MILVCSWLCARGAVWSRVVKFLPALLKKQRVLGGNPEGGDCSDIVVAFLLRICVAQGCVMPSRKIDVLFLPFFPLHFGALRSFSSLGPTK